MEGIVNTKGIKKGLHRALFACILLLLMAGQSFAQNKILANQVTYTSGQKGILYSDPTVENPNNALSDDDSFARLLASPGLAVGLGSYKGVIELKFANTRPANTWSYVRLEGDNSLFKALLGGSLGEVLGDVLGYVLIGNQEITVDARMGGTSILSRSSTQGFGTNRVKLLRNGSGDYYLAIKPDSDYDRIRISNEVGSLIGLGTEKQLDVYYAFYFDNNSGSCGKPFATSFDGSGIDLQVLPIDDQHLDRAIDSSLDSYSTLKQPSLLDVNIAGSLSQYFYFSNSSSEKTSVNMKISLGSGGVINTDLLGATEVLFYDDSDNVVYERSLMSSLLNNTDVLNLLGSGSAVIVTFAPGESFTRMEVRLNSPVGVGLLGSALQIYDVQRFDEDAGCENPEVDHPSPTAGPLESPSCSQALLGFENVDFPQNAVDDNNESFATIYADAGSLLVSGPTTGYIEMDLGNVPANKTTYVRIGYDEDVLNRLLGGSLGKLVSDLGNDLLLGNQFIQVQAKDGANVILDESSSDAFEGTSGGTVNLVQDSIGRYYLAIAPNQDYDRIRITNHVVAVLPTGKKASLDVYDACFDMGEDPCFGPNFTSYRGGGVNLSLADLNNAGVKDPYKAIDDNSSSYSEISVGTAGIAAHVYQSIYFSQPSETDDSVRIRLMVEPSSALSLDLLGTYKIKFYNNGQQVGQDYTLQDGLINNIDLLALFNTGGSVTLTYAPQGEFDRVDIGMATLASLGLTPPLRVYDVQRFGKKCALSTTNPPYYDPTCATNLIAASNADDVQNLFDDDFDSFSTLKSGSGILLGLGQYEGFVEMGYQQPQDAGTTSYIRIDFDDGILKDLLSGSLGNFAGNLLNNLLLGNHYFEVEVKRNTYDNNGEVINSVMVDQATSKDNGGGNDDIRVVQDAQGRYYIAITPDDEYNAVRITDHSISLVGATAQPNTMHVYGMCTEKSMDECIPAFATSYEYEGLSLSVSDLSGSGVTNPERAIDGNTQHYSEISNGTLSIEHTTKQWIFFTTVSDQNRVVNIKFSTEQGGIDLNLLGNLQIVAYKGDVPVDTLRWQDGIVNGVNVLQLLSNNQIVEVPFVIDGQFDRISVGLHSAVGASVFPPVHLYSVKRCVDFTPVYKVSGAVFHDNNGLTDGQIDDADSLHVDLGLNVVAVDKAQDTVVATTAVDANGAYQFISLENNDYTFILTKDQPAVGSASPASTLPVNNDTAWVSTGEYHGTGAGEDGTVDGKLELIVQDEDLTNANFGIEQAPVAGNGHMSATNPGNTAIPVPAEAFTNDNESGDADGTVDSMIIKDFPADLDQITIDGNTYDSNSWPAEGIRLAVTADGQPTVAIDVMPLNQGITQVNIEFYTIDNAGKESPNPGNAILYFTSLYGISGTVFEDKDAGTPDGIPMAGVTVKLLDDQEAELQSTQTNNNGNYTFANRPDGNYFLVVVPPADYFAVGSAHPYGLSSDTMQLSINSTDSGGWDFGLFKAPIAKDDESTGNIPATAVSLNVFDDNGHGSDVDGAGESLSASGTTLKPETVNFVNLGSLPSGSQCTQTASEGCIEVTVPGEGVWSVDNTGKVTFSPDSSFYENPTPIHYIMREEAGLTSNEGIVTIQYTAHPKIAIVKSHNLSQPNNGCYNIQVGDDITYTFEVTNPGDVGLSTVNVEDELSGLSAVSFDSGDDNNDDVLDPSETWNYTATYTVTQADMDSGRIVNQATVTGVAPNGDAVKDTSGTGVNDNDKTVIELCQSGDMEMIKAGNFDDANGDGVANVGEDINYSITVSNTGNVTLSAIQVTDPRIGGNIGMIHELAPSTDSVLNFTYTLTQMDIDSGGVHNIAYGAGTDPQGDPVRDTSTSNNPLDPGDDGYDPDCPDCTYTPVPQSGDMEMIKAGNFDDANGDGVANVGEDINYSITVSNTGNVTLSDIQVTDPRIGGNIGTIQELAPSTDSVLNFTYTLTQMDIDSGGVHNIAYGAGTDPQGDPVRDTSTSNNPLDPGDDGYDPDCPDCTYTPVPQEPDIAVVKMHDLGSVPSEGCYDIGVGDEITYTFTVTNEGNVSLSDIDVTDVLSAISTPSLDAGDDNSNDTLDVGETWTYTAVYTVTQEAIDTGRITNRATVEGLAPDGTKVSDQSGSAIDNDDETVIEICGAPKMDMIKAGNFDDANGDGVANVGEDINYSITVSNTGNVTLSDIQVTDPRIGGNIGMIHELAPSTDSVLNFTYTLTQMDIDSGGVHNIAYGAGTDPQGDPVRDTSTSNNPLNPGDDGYDPDCPDCTYTPVPQSGDMDMIKAGNFDDANGDGVANVGEDINYSITVSNTGNVTLSDIQVTDPRIGGNIGMIHELAPNTDSVLNFTYTLTQMDIDSGGVHNIAYGAGTDPQGDPVRDTSTSNNPLNPGDDGYDPDCPDCTYTPVPQSGDMEMIKAGNFDDANGDGVANVGEDINYSITVSNTGNVTLSAIQVTDPRIGGNIGMIHELAPSTDSVLNFTYTLTQMDIDSGGVHNIAYGAGTDPQGDPVRDTSTSYNPLNPGDDGYDPDCPDCTYTPVPQSGDMEMIKAGNFDDANGDGVANVGEDINYSITVSNTGNVTLSAIQVTDPRIGGNIGMIHELAPSTDSVLNFNYTLTQMDIDSGGVHNIAYGEGTDPQGDPVRDTSVSNNPLEPGDDGYDPDCPDCTYTPVPQSGDMEMIKAGNFDDANGDGVANVGEDINYSITVSNTGNVTLTGIQVTDPRIGGNIGMIHELAPSTDSVLNFTYTLTQMDIDSGGVHNIAYGEGTDPQGDPVRDTSTSNNPLQPGDDGYDPDCPDCTYTPVPQSGDMEMIKAGNFNDTNGDGVANVGEDINYSITVSNTGNVTLTGIQVTDPRIGGNIGMIHKLAPSTDSVLNFTYTLTQMDIDSGGVHNIAYGAGTDPQGDPVRDTSTSNNPLNPGDDGYDPDCPDCTYTPVPQEPDIAVVKMHDLGSVPSEGCYDIGVGDEITYTFTVTNEGNVSLSDIDLTDVLSDISTPSIDAGDDNSNDTLDVGETWTYTAVYTVTQEAIDTGRITNRATVEGLAPDGTKVSDQSGSGVDNDDETVIEICGEPKMKLIKDGNFNDANGDGVANVGDEITYTFTVNNIGNVNLKDITINDPKVTVNGSISSLAPGSNNQLTATYTITQADIDSGGVYNLSTATGKDPHGNTVKDQSESSSPLQPGDENYNPDCPDCTYTPITQNAGMKLIKDGVYDDANGDGTTNIGDEITYTFTVTNTGNVTLKNITISDPKVTVNGSIATLTPGADGQLTVAYPITNDDISAGGVYNLSTATGEDPQGEAVTDKSESSNPLQPDDPNYDPSCPDCTFTPLEQDPPKANDDKVDVETPGDEATIPDILGNDEEGSCQILPQTVILTSADGTQKGVNIVVSGQGTWRVDQQGDVTFVPEEGFLDDPDPITYTVSDACGGVSNEATLSVDYNQIPPVANDDAPEETIARGGTLDDFDILANDKPGNEGALVPSTVSLVPTKGTCTEHDEQNRCKAVKVQGEGTWEVTDDGTVSFTPVDNISGDPTPMGYTVEDEGGQVSNVATITLDVFDGRDFFIPNSFTPNSDGHNDVWKVYGSNVKSVHIMVYNQYGQRLYEAHGANTEWDGRFEGNTQPSGVYIYVAEITFYDGTSITKKGSITLIR